MPRAKTATSIHPFDIKHGTDTSGLIRAEHIARGTAAMPVELTAYYGIAPSILSTVLNIWLQRTAPPAPIEQTVFLDIGAGKGRALLLASQHPFLRVEGVELNSEMVKIAQQNIERWALDPHAEALTGITLHHADATIFDLPSEPTVAFLFHPFERTLMRRFLRHAEASRAQIQAPLDLLYVNAEHRAMLDRNAAFKRMWAGRVPMSTADHVADLAEIAQQDEYGSTGDEFCAIYRYTGRSMASAADAE